MKMNKTVTLGQFLGAMVLILGGVFTFVISTSSINAAQDARLKALEETQRVMLENAQEQTQVLYKIAGSLESK